MYCDNLRLIFFILTIQLSFKVRVPNIFMVKSMSFQVPILALLVSGANL
ncbi:hypothetical protein PMIT1313_01091 [Prochlorococcus marinus str. MIT 1313]|nr:hypothetical protein PMIT1313_01091 [Prochlorococcus marinus str. MIT 1313]KZR72328.1 hypothetical protein PMIT1318_01388 [Prochlorococcus marinus str. MIT 1318]